LKKKTGIGGGVGEETGRKVEGNPPKLSCSEEKRGEGEESGGKQGWGRESLYVILLWSLLRNGQTYMDIRIKEEGSKRKAAGGVVFLLALVVWVWEVFIGWGEQKTKFPHPW